MTVEGLPTGVTATFAPASLASGVSSSELSLTVATSAAAATTNLTLRASGTGVTTATRAVALAVTVPDPGNFSLTLSPATLTLTAGQSASSTVSITRSGGFTGAVSMSMEGLPSGVTAAFTPATVTGAQAQLSITASGAAAAGAFTATVRGSATGLGARTASLAVTVQTGGGGGGSGAVVWQFCDTQRIPLWFAWQDGTSGAWTRVVAGPNQTYPFSLSQNVGAVAYVQTQAGVAASLIILRSSRTELQSLALAECLTNPARKTINGTVTGLSAGQLAGVAVGSATAFISPPATSFTLNNVSNITTDLLAARATVNATTFATTPDRFVLRRSINPPAGGTLPVVDFASAEAFAPASAQYTIENTGGEQLSSSIGLFTNNGPVGFFSFNDPLATGNTRTVYGLPAARTQGGDLHQVQFIAVAASGVSSRQILQYNRDITARTLTLGPVVNAPQLSTAASAPYARIRAIGTWQAEYGDGFGVGFSQNEGGGRIWSVQTSRAYAGTGPSYSVELPDFSGVAGFNLAWGLQSGLATQWSLSAAAIFGGGAGPAVEGYFQRAGFRSGTYTP